MLILHFSLLGSNVICIRLWGKYSNIVLQGMHGFFGLGAFVSPLIAAPFLDNDDGELPPKTVNSTRFEDQHRNFSANISFITADIQRLDVLNITYPFSFVGAFTLFVAVLHLPVCVISPTENEHQVVEKKDKPEKSFFFMFSTILLTYLIFFVFIGTEIGYGQTLTTYAVKGALHATPTVGSYMTSAFWAAFTFSRLISVFLAIKISSLVQIVSDICIISISALILLFLMPNQWALWVATVLFGAGAASAYGAIIGWVGTHINISNKVSSIFTTGVATGEMAMPFIIAYLIDVVPEIFVYVIVVSCILTTIFVVVLQCIFKKGSRIPVQKSVECYAIEVK